jgi:hypothetical protein
MSSTEAREVLISAETWRHYADEITTALTSSSPRRSGARDFSQPSKLQRLLHALGRHDWVPFEVWDFGAKGFVDLDIDVCHICGEAREYE